jgi:hypothetical protein
MARVSPLLPVGSKNELVERESGQHFDHGRQLDTQNVQVGMPFPHVGDGLMQVTCRHSFYRRFAFASRNRRRCVPVEIQSAAQGALAGNVFWACATA